MLNKILGISNKKLKLLWSTKIKNLCLKIKKKNTGKYGPEQLRIRTIFTQHMTYKYAYSSGQNIWNGVKKSSKIGEVWKILII